MKNIFRYLCKKGKKGVLTVVFAALLPAPAFAGTIITAPIDSRPVSIDYLSKLAEMAGDKVLTADKNILDFFPDGGVGSRFTKSEKVRQEIRKNVKANDNKNTTVILNTSSYFTGGLVGSRCADNYEDYQEALEELHSLLTEYPDPTYYVALAMPRNLPETRNNIIWFDDKPVRSLGYYFLQGNSDDSVSGAVLDTVKAKYTRAAPTQFLMEWSYVKNKETELGPARLTKWERDFLNDVAATKEFQPYLERYQKPFQSTGEIFSSLMRWQKRGLIDEVVVSQDDLQLPEFITYMYQNLKPDWIPLENGSPIKYSFARTYTTSGEDGIFRKIKLNYNSAEAEKALMGTGDNVNFIFGMDEIPQLIYARDLSKRFDLTADFQPEFYGVSETVADYDVLNSRKLTEFALNFVSRSENKTERPLYLFLYDYQNASDPQKAIEQMKEKFQSGAVGLIELYNAEVLSTGNHAVFDTLWRQNSAADKRAADRFTLPRLACYSAWNTNANAIGLGVAHGQVYSILAERAKDKASLLEIQTEILGQHLLEDGIYNVKGKRALAAEGFHPSAKETENASKLEETVKPEELENLFINTVFEFGGKKYNLERYSVQKLDFPWKRLFECYVDIQSAVKK